jgi:hypothetical protein
MTQPNPDHLRPPLSAYISLSAYIYMAALPPSGFRLPLSEASPDKIAHVADLDLVRDAAEGDDRPVLKFPMT